MSAFCAPAVAHPAPATGGTPSHISDPLPCSTLTGNAQTSLFLLTLVLGVFLSQFVVHLGILPN